VPSGKTFATSSKVTDATCYTLRAGSNRRQSGDG